MNIKEFIDNNVTAYNNKLKKMSASEVLLNRNTGIDWETEFTKHGFIPVQRYKRDLTDDVFEWCNLTFGKEHYAAFYRSTKGAYTFWFEKPANATMFILRYGK